MGELFAFCDRKNLIFEKCIFFFYTFNPLLLNSGYGITEDFSG